MMILRFDGSFRAGAGGAGAVLLSDASSVELWQGARFLESCSTSAHAEFEGLILGLEAARTFEPASLHVEGDCRVVLAQASGKARSRKLSKLNARANAAITQLLLSTAPTFDSIPREKNSQADALSRAAMDAVQALYAAAVIACARGGELQGALSHLEEAARARVPMPPRVYAELMETCHESHEWEPLLSVFGAARRDRGALRGSRCDRAFAYASGALEALGATSRGTDRASRQLVLLRRELAELQRSRQSAQRRAATLLLRDSSPRALGSVVGFPSGDEATGDVPARDAGASAWRTHLVREVGGLEALTGDDLAAVPRLLRLAEDLTCATGFAYSGGHIEPHEGFHFADLHI